MRGAIAVALVYYYFDPKGMAADSHRSTIIATTLIVVLFSTVVFSAATKPLLEFMLGAGMPACALLSMQPCACQLQALLQGATQVFKGWGWGGGGG